VNPDVERAASYQAHRFARITGMDVDDLMQESRLAALAAVGRTAEHYDPRKASMFTYLSAAISWRLTDVARKAGRRVPTVSIDTAGGDDEEGGARGIEVADPGPSPEDLAIFRDLLRQMPDDALAVVRLVLDDASSIANLVDVRRAVARRLGWTADRVEVAVACVGLALSRGGMSRRRAPAAS
jgi:DNA-directed RNA polymerase specialized sigma24 family protein